MVFYQSIVFGMRVVYWLIFLPRFTDAIGLLIDFSTFYGGDWFIDWFLPHDVQAAGRKIKPADIFADPDDELDEGEHDKKETDKKKKREPVINETATWVLLLLAWSNIYKFSQ